MNIIFLHIPKTAGQSVHAFLTSNFQKESFFPARENAQAVKYTVEEIRSYHCFSGHIDYSLFECIHQPRFMYTILRDPMDRILSYYFYILKEAKKLTKEEISLPNRQGMKAILELSPDEYFAKDDMPLRDFVDNHYDNFYMYFFAMKSYSGKSLARQLMSINNDITIDEIYNMALENLSKLDAVYDISNWSQLKDDLSKYFPNKTWQEKDFFVNMGDGNSSEERLKQLVKLGATEKTFNKINDFCKYDNTLYEKLCK